MDFTQAILLSCNNCEQVVDTCTSVIKHYLVIWYWPKSTGAVWWEGNCRPGRK